jgi:23S rRNA pseudouridine1911/1915/1917 synthase
VQIEVEAESAGRRIDQLLGDIDRIGSRANAERLVVAGKVLVNGATPVKSLRLKRGDIVEIEDDALSEPPPAVYADVAVPVLYEDDFVLVVDKPAGMVVHPAPGYKPATLIEILVAGGTQLADSDDPEYHRPGVVHRLDKDTSGVIAFAKS